MSRSGLALGAGAATTEAGGAGLGDVVAAGPPRCSST